ncbi:hypothetical protein HWI79_3591 [Cryptosporidium felis]|nr:hypothetical protein HWI79_3591 [Cryptosporidium felis]
MKGRSDPGRGQCADETRRERDEAGGTVGTMYLSGFPLNGFAWAGGPGRARGVGGESVQEELVAPEVGVGDPLGDDFENLGVFECGLDSLLVLKLFVYGVLQVVSSLLDPDDDLDVSF